MSGTSAKKIVKWHEEWLGEKDANGDLIRDWAQYFDKESSSAGIAMWRGSSVMVEEPA